MPMKRGDPCAKLLKTLWILRRALSMSAFFTSAKDLVLLCFALVHGLAPRTKRLANARDAAFNTRALVFGACLKGVALNDDSQANRDASEVGAETGAKDFSALYCSADKDAHPPL